MICDPALAIVQSADEIAPIPDAVAIAASAFSRAATFCSSTVDVGFPRRVYINPLSSPANLFPPCSQESK